MGARQDRNGDRGTKVPHRRRARATMLGCCLAMAAAVGGCVHLPRQSAPPAIPAPPPVPQGGVGSGSVPVAAIEVTDESTTFRKTATDRQRFQVHLDFGKVFEAQGNFEQAVREYQDALAVAESRAPRKFTAADRALAHRRIAAALDRLGRFPQAEVHYQKAMKLSPKDPKVWNDAGYSYYLQGRWPEAERALRTAWKLAPEDALIRTNLGLTLAAAGRSQEAFPLLSRSEGDAIGHANLGYLLAATGQYEAARQHYQTALAMRPDLDLARRALAQLDRQQRGPTPAPPTQVARAAKPTARPVDPRVMPASTSGSDEILLPPLPPLPPPKPPSRTLP